MEKKKKDLPRAEIEANIHKKRQNHEEKNMKKI